MEIEDKDISALKSGYYSEHERHFVSVDCVIFGLREGKLCILLIKRRMMPGKGKWSLMGGFVEKDESLDEAARRVLYQLTGLENVFMDQVGTFGNLNRDPGARVISVAYCALLNFDEHDPDRLSENDAHWIPLDEMPQLYFDHPEIVEKGLEYLRMQVHRKPIVFQFLPELFTLSQLQGVYEAILGEKLDKRNFRKRVMDSKVLEKTEFIDKSGSKRGATLYRYNA